MTAGHMILVTTVLGPQVGPMPLVVLAIVDFAVGTFALVAGVAFVFRRGWGQKLLAYGAIPIAMYGLGRSLGLAVGDVTEFNYLSMLVTIGIAGSWVLVAWGALSWSSTLYVTSRQAG